MFSASGFGNNGRRNPNESIIICAEIAVENLYGFSDFGTYPVYLALCRSGVCFRFGSGNYQYRYSSAGGGGSDYLLSAKRYHPFAHGIFNQSHGFAAGGYLAAG